MFKITHLWLKKKSKKKENNCFSLHCQGVAWQNKFPSTFKWLFNAVIFLNLSEFHVSWEAMKRTIDLAVYMARPWGKKQQKSSYNWHEIKASRNFILETHLLNEVRSTGLSWHSNHHLPLMTGVCRMCSHLVQAYRSILYGALKLI